MMKEIMAKESSEQDQGVASFACFDATEKHQTLFEFLRPLSDLEEVLLTHFAGQKLTMRQVYERHNVGRRFIKANYKKALTRIEAADRITTEPPAAKRPRKLGEVTFADGVLVTFPERAKS